MENIKVATVQMNALMDDLEHNLNTHARFIEEAAGEGCALILFPEISTTAHYGDPRVVQFAEEAGNGPVYTCISGLAKKHDLVVSYGFCEKAHGTYYNTQALVGPKGLLGIQRKVHASGDEYFSFRMGRSFHVYDLGFAKAGTLICYDTAFSESWRILALMGAELIMTPHAGRKGGMGSKVPPREQLENLQKKRESMPGRWGLMAAENGVFAAHCNQAGFNGHSTHNGGATIVDPLGSMIAQGPLSTDDLMITGELDAEILTQARRKKGFTLHTRRPEVYDILTEMI